MTDTVAQTIIDEVKKELAGIRGIMTSPIEQLIDSAVTCNCCGVHMGGCDCWLDDTPRCNCKVHFGCLKHCREGHKVMLAAQQEES